MQRRKAPHQSTHLALPKFMSVAHSSNRENIFELSTRFIISQFLSDPRMCRVYMLETVYSLFQLISVTVLYEPEGRVESNFFPKFNAHSHSCTWYISKLK